jgi:hypothetical protein
MKKKDTNNSVINDIIKKSASESMISYEDLPKYDLFLSQVTDYLNDQFKGENYTNNIIQNYIKNEIISKPEDGKKRGYTKKHIIELILLSYMRPILTSDEIKKVFSLAFNEINSDDDDILTWESSFKIFSSFQKESYDELFSKNIVNEDRLNNILEENDVNLENRKRIKAFFIIMSLIAQASTIKKIARDLVEDSEEEE